MARSGKATIEHEAGGFSLWSPETGKRGHPETIFFGRIDNRGEMRSELALDPPASDQDIYRAAFARFGDRVEARLTGHYCAITVLGPRRLRLVRSPWTAPPLYFASSDSRMAASPMLSCLFAAGIERQVDYDYLRDQLAFDHHDCEPRGWYRGIGRVPLGTRILCSGSDVRIERYYDPAAVPRVRLRSDGDYVERARELIDDAARTAIDGARKPAIMLSAGLDSPIVAEAVIRALPPGQRLPSFTFGPVESWDGRAPAGSFGEEREAVKRFAALHPRLEPHFPDPSRGGHDYLLRELLALTETPTANVANIGIFHAPLQDAVAAGCDRMLTAMLGNFTFSLDGDWAAAHYLRTLRWRRLAAIIATPLDGDDRSRLRRFLALAVLPNLPPGVQQSVRRRFHPERFTRTPPASPLSPQSVERWRKERGAASAFDRPAIARNRQQAIRWMWESADSGEDLDLGLESLHDIEFRDVSAYRPLIEFCHGIPVGQFRRAGIDRFLARRLAKGIMPEEQRLEQRQGHHNVDWHARIAPRRAELHRQFEAFRLHERFAGMLDIDRLQALLEDWGEQTPLDHHSTWQRKIAVTRALTAGAFLSHAERRNDF